MSSSKGTIRKIFPPHILLVEDDPFVREATWRMLESLGFFVHPAAAAEEAIQIYEQCGTPIDLLITDMVLAGTNGRQLCKDIRQRSARVKVLVTSGYGNPEYETEDPSASLYFLAKPYSRQSLQAKIETILGPPSWLADAAQAG
jgi:two-component system, cell cycle sensor histidine kinase and response regulator CckA